MNMDAMFFCVSHISVWCWLLMLCIITELLSSWPSMEVFFVMGRYKRERCDVVYSDEFLGDGTKWDMWALGLWCLSSKSKVCDARSMQNHLSNWLKGGLSSMCHIYHMFDSNAIDLVMDEVKWTEDVLTRSFYQHNKTKNDGASISHFVMLYLRSFFIFVRWLLNI